MKHIKYNAAIMAIIALLISCEKESTLIPNDNKVEDAPITELIHTTGTMTFTAIADNEFDTKTSLSGHEVSWGANELIYLFDGYAPHAFYSDNDAAATTVNFTGSASTASKYYAVYPSGTMSGLVITTTIPTYQAATANTFAPKANVAVACTAAAPTGDNVLKFKNVGAVVKFRVANSDVRKVRLDAIGGEKLSGTMTVTYDGEGNFSTAMVGASSESCVIMNSASNLSTSSDYYFVINPTTYASGLRITLFKADGSYKTISNKTSNTLARNEMMDFGTLPEIATWKSAPVLFNESFSKFDYAGGNDGNYSGGSGSFSAANCDESSWTFTGNMYAAKNCVRVGKDADATTFTTRALDLSSGTITLDFRAALFGSDGTTLTLSVDHGTISPSSVTLQASKWNSYKATITGGTASTKISFHPARRCFLDDIVVTGASTVPADPAVSSPVFEVTDKTPDSGVIAAKDGEASFTVHSTIPWAIKVSDEEHVAYSVSAGSGEDEMDVAVLFDDLAAGSRDFTFTVIPSTGDPADVYFSQSNSVSIPESDITRSASSALKGTVNSMLGYKLGTGSGTQTLTIKKGYKTIEFYAAGWSSGTNTFSFTNGQINSSTAAITLTNNSSVNGTNFNGDDFSVTGLSGTKYTLDVTSTSTDVTITMQRGAIWGFQGAK